MKWIINSIFKSLTYIDKTHKMNINNYVNSFKYSISHNN